MCVLLYRINEIYLPCLSVMTILSVLVINTIDKPMNTIMHSLIKNNEEEILKICDDNHVRSLYFFGSIVDADKFTDISDIDILVSFEEGISLEDYTDCYFNLIFALEDLLGRVIDITTERSVKKPYFKEELERTKVLFYDSLAEANG